jgi:hypothetical protein
LVSCVLKPCVSVINATKMTSELPHRLRFVNAVS